MPHNNGQTGMKKGSLFVAQCPIFSYASFCKAVREVVSHAIFQLIFALEPSTELGELGEWSFRMRCFN